MKRIAQILLVCILLCSVTAAQTIVVGSYNIRYRNDEDSIRGHVWSKRCKAICDQINWQQPVVLGAQEVLHRQLNDLLSGLDGYEYIGVGRDDGRTKGEYAPIFYRAAEVELKDSGHFWLSPTPDHPSLGWDAACVRICTWGRFRMRSSGREFLFMNLHMDHVGITARREAAKMVMEHVATMTAQHTGTPVSVMLTGDFNVDQTDEIYTIFTASGQLKDCYTTARLRMAENGTFHGYHPERYTSSRIDHIFVSNDITVDAYAIHTDAYWTDEGDGKHQLRHPSDHYPVFARISLTTDK